MATDCTCQSRRVNNPHARAWRHKLVPLTLGVLGPRWSLLTRRPATQERVAGSTLNWCAPIPSIPVTRRPSASNTPHMLGRFSATSRSSERSCSTASMSRLNSAIMATPFASECAGRPTARARQFWPDAVVRREAGARCDSGPGPTPGLAFTTKAEPEKVQATPDSHWPTTWRAKLRQPARPRHRCRIHLATRKQAD